MSKSNPREKFIELAEKRVSRALKDIHLIGNLSNKTNYKYSNEDAKKIYKVLINAIEEMRGRFERQERKGNKLFKL